MVQTSSIFLSFFLKMHNFSSQSQITVQPSMPKSTPIRSYTGLIETLTFVFGNWSKFQAGGISVTSDYFETRVERSEVLANLESENCGLVFCEKVAFSYILELGYLFPGSSFAIRIILRNLFLEIYFGRNGSRGKLSRLNSRKLETLGKVSRLGAISFNP